jgi:hypothetical protein
MAKWNEGIRLETASIRPGAFVGGSALGRLSAEKKVGRASE